MDPKQTLLDAKSYIDNYDFAEFLVYMGNYADWRKKGGFEPKFHSTFPPHFETPGDHYYYLLAECYKGLTGGIEGISPLC